MGQADDLDRLAHIEAKYFPTLCLRGTLQDQSGCLGDGHEIADYLRMGDGDRPAAGDLLAEQGYHAAG